jgi:hypothetical protein
MKMLLYMYLHTRRQSAGVSDVLFADVVPDQHSWRRLEHTLGLRSIMHALQEGGNMGRLGYLGRVDQDHAGS